MKRTITIVAIVCLSIAAVADDRSDTLKRRWRSEAARGRALTYPSLNWDDLTDGTWGLACSHQQYYSRPGNNAGKRNEERIVVLKVLKRLDEDDRALISVEGQIAWQQRVNFANRSYFDLRFLNTRSVVLAEGFRFDSVVDGTVWQVNEPVEVSGNYQYKSKDGMQTIKIIRPTVLLPLPRDQFGLGVGMRTWTSNKGGHTTDATYLSYTAKDGLVHLIKRDGKRIDVPLDKLSEADRNFVRAKTKQR